LNAFDSQAERAKTGAAGAMVMPATGATPRALGLVLTVGGAVALAVGLIALMYAADWLRDGAQSGRASSDEGDTIEGLVLGGGTLAVAGFIALLIGVFLLAISRNLEKRVERKRGDVAEPVSEPARKARKKAN
jgi:hypothetical protein